MTRWRFRWTVPLLTLVLATGHAWALNGSWESAPVVAGRTNPTMIHDATYQRLVIFGGFDGGKLRGDTWQLNLANPSGPWSKMLFSSEPPGRAGHTAVFDISMHKMFVFGGLVFDPNLEIEVPTNEVWILPLNPSGEWQKAVTTGTAPPGLAWHTAVLGFDASNGHEKMFVYGGHFLGGDSNRTFALDLNTMTWQEISTAGARTIRYHAAAIDAPQQYMYVFGGEEIQGGTSTVVKSVWRLDLLTGFWSQITFGPNATQPPPMINARALFDSSRRELVVYGGKTPTNPVASEVIYRLNVDSPTTWTLLQPTGGSHRRESHALAFSPVQHRLWVFGGTEGLASPSGAIMPSDTWTVSLDPTPTPVWTPLDVRPHPGTWFTEHSMVYDSINGRTILFGGMANSFLNNDLYVFGLPSSSDFWAVPTATGTPPAPRYGHTAIYDYSNQRMLVFGGQGASAVLQDVIALNLSGGNYAWSALTPGGTGPGPHEGHSAVYADQVASNRRMIVFGGSNGSVLKNDVWALTLNGTPTWQLLQTNGNPKPAARRDHTAVYDYITNRMFVYGGTKADGAPSDEVWVLDLANNSNTWTKQNVNPKPPARTKHVAVFSPYGDRRMLIFGGKGATGDLRDAWALDTWNADPNQWVWSQISFTVGASPAEREDAAAAITGFGRITITGGFFDDQLIPFIEPQLENYNDTWNLQYNPTDP